jgi:hypothetical protein
MNEKSEPPEPVPHAEAFAETVPSAPTWRQRVPTPPALEITRFVVEAVERTARCVEVAFVVVPNVTLNRAIVEDAERIKPEVVALVPACG